MEKNNNKTIAIIVAVSIPLTIALLIVLQLVKNNDGSSMSMASTNASTSTGETLAEREKRNAGNYLQLPNYSFENVPLSRKLRVYGTLGNSSKTLTFKNILMEAEFYDATGTKVLHTSRFRVDYLENRLDFEEFVRFPLSVAKLDVQKIKIKILSFRAVN